MATISASDVKALRDETGLPMMDCKKALEECQGDKDAAVKLLREKGAKIAASRGPRETSFGRMGTFTDHAKVGALVELQCESAPVTSHEEFKMLVDALAQQLAKGSGAANPEALLDQPSPLHAGKTLREVRDDLFNRIREVFNLARIVRVDGLCQTYAHHAGVNTLGVLLEYEGGNPEAAKDICLHIAAMRPKSLTRDDLDPAIVEKEREILSQQARNEGKPENIIQKMIEGRMKNFFAEIVLKDQAFAKDNSMTVGQFADQAKLKMKRFVLWELGKS